MKTTGIIIFICCAILCALVLIPFHSYLVYNRSVRKYWKRKWLRDLEKLNESEDYKKGFRKALEMTDIFDK